MKIRLALLLAAFAATSGCSLFSFDHTKRIAARTLLDDQGSLDEAVYSAALAARFPVGSSVEPLRSYATANGGTCRDQDSQRLWCEIPVSGAICYSHMIGIDVQV